MDGCNLKGLELSGVKIGSRARERSRHHSRLILCTEHSIVYIFQVPKMEKKKKLINEHATTQKRKSIRFEGDGPIQRANVRVKEFGKTGRRGVHRQWKKGSPTLTA